MVIIIPIFHISSKGKTIKKKKCCYSITSAVWRCLYLLGLVLYDSRDTAAIPEHWLWRHEDKELKKAKLKSSVI